MVHSRVFLGAALTAAAALSILVETAAAQVRAGSTTSATTALAVPALVGPGATTATRQGQDRPVRDPSAAGTLATLSTTAVSDSPTTPPKGKGDPERCLP